MGLSSTLSNYKTNNSSEKPNCHKNFEMYHQKLQRINPTGVYAPWDDSYFKKLNKSSKILPPNLDGNSFNKCNVRTKQFKTLTKNNFPDVGLNNQLNLFMSYSLSSDSIWTHHAIEMP